MKSQFFGALLSLVSKKKAQRFFLLNDKESRKEQRKEKQKKQGFTKHDESRTTSIALRTVNKAKVLYVCVFVLFLFFPSLHLSHTKKKEK